MAFDPDTSGVRRVAQALANLTTSNPTYARAMQVAGAIYMADMQKRYVANSRGGGEWPELAPSTRRARASKASKGGYVFGRRKGSNAIPAHLPILIDNGDLFRSLGPGGAGRIEQMLPDGIRMGTTDFKAKFHQYGTRKMPRRSILVQPTPEASQRMRNTIESAVTAVIQGIHRNNGRN